MEMNPRKPLWRIPIAIVLFVISLPAGFYLTIYALLSLYPDAGPGAMIFLPIAALAALIIAGLTVGAFLLFTAVRWWAGLPVVALVLLVLAGVGISFVNSMATMKDSMAYCEVNNPKPGADLGNCVAVYTVTAERNPAASLFASHGWKVSSGEDRPEKIDLGSPIWRLWAAFSKDVDLDLTPYDGKEVRVISFLVTGAPLPGPNKQECHTEGKAVLGSDGQVVGAWIECRSNGGGASQVLPGYSVKRRSVEQVTGKPWREFR